LKSLPVLTYLCGSLNKKTSSAAEIDSSTHVNLSYQSSWHNQDLCTW
jgi:hypothetical protein